MKAPRVLTDNPVRAAATVTYDFYAFTTFVLFLALVAAVGSPLRATDRVFGTSFVARLARFFELCGGL